MEFRVSTYTLFSLPIDLAIEKLISEDWKHIEIMGEGEQHGRLLLEMEEERLVKFAKAGKDSGVSFGFHLPIKGFNPAFPDEYTERVWKKCLPIIELFQMKYVLFHPGIHPSANEGIHTTAQFAKRMLKDLPLQTKLVIENVPAANNLIGSSIDQLISIIQKVGDDQVGFMFDTGHGYINDGERLLAEFQKTIPYLSGLHISDNHGLLDEHLQIGEGSVPFQDLFIQLKGHNLEFVLETNSLERAEESKAKIIKFYKESHEESVG